QTVQWLSRAVADLVLANALRCGPPSAPWTDTIRSGWWWPVSAATPLRYPSDAPSAFLLALTPGSGQRSDCSSPVAGRFSATLLWPPRSCSSGRHFASADRSLSGSSRAGTPSHSVACETGNAALPLVHRKHVPHRLVALSIHQLPPDTAAPDSVLDPPDLPAAL